MEIIWGAFSAFMKQWLWSDMKQGRDDEAEKAHVTWEDDESYYLTF